MQLTYPSSSIVAEKRYDVAKGAFVGIGYFWETVFDNADNTYNVLKSLRSWGIPTIFDATVTKTKFKAALPNYSILYFCGHGNTITDPTSRIVYFTNAIEMFPDFLNDGSHAFAQDKMFIRGDEIKDANINNKYTFAFINSCLSGDISYLGKNNANQFRGAFKIENGAYLGWAISPVIKDTFTYGKLFFEKLGEKDANGVYNSAREVQTYLSNNNNLWGGTILYGDTTVRK